MRYAAPPARLYGRRRHFITDFQIRPTTSSSSLPPPIIGSMAGAEQPMPGLAHLQWGLRFLYSDSVVLSLLMLLFLRALSLSLSFALWGHSLRPVNCDTCTRAHTNTHTPLFCSCEKKDYWTFPYLLFTDIENWEFVVGRSLPALMCCRWSGSLFLYVSVCLRMCVRRRVLVHKG